MKIPNVKRCVTILALMTIAECGSIGAIGILREGFWNSVSNHDLTQFILYLVYFAVVALFACLVSGYGQYIGSYLSLVLRRQLTRKALKTIVQVENYQQRIQEDCMVYNQLKIGLIVGGVRNTVILLTYATILVYQLSWGYLTLPIAYAIIGTLIAAKIARPLINLNYINQNLEAAFRQVLSKLNYARAHRNNYNLFKTTKYLSYFQSFYGQITVMVPYLILAPAYFGLKITFGIFMQTASAMNTVIDSLSYGINSFNDFNRYLSCRRRLQESKII